MPDETTKDCYTCRQQQQAELPPREDVVHTDHWRVATAFDSALPGWLVLVPTRHLLAFSELAPAAADELGGLVRRLSLALEQVTGCVKTYLMQFSEAEGFAHLHLHLVPRATDHPDDARGPRVFAFLGVPEPDRVTDAERDRLAVELRAALASIPAG